MPNAHAPLRWSAYEHEHLERGSDWFWALGIAAVCIALTSVLFHDVLFAILIIIAAATLALHAKHPPAIVEFEISERGIRIGDVLHRWKEVLAFWVDDESAEPVLLIDTVKFLAPNLVIPLENVDPHAVREYLHARVEEVPMKEPLAHKILEFFGL